MNNHPCIPGKPCIAAPHDCLQEWGNGIIQDEFRVFWEIWEASIPPIDEALIDWRADTGQKPLL
jgi:hypothetical protein